MTRDIYLEITYRHGKALAGYLYLAKSSDDKVVRSQKVSPGLVVDYGADGKPIGIEITSPSTVSAQAINELLAELHQQTLDKAELAPLLVS
ncbi:MAG: DUF2283 domain-containing protein [Planctomycetota bacterium]|nr:DUF2283 domain-containing protein [Planctomycetota bacterium]